MDKAPLERLDSFPYRHRVAEVMHRPLAVADPGMTLEAAARRMIEQQVSSLVMLDEQGRATGIVTERDILRALAQDGAGAATDPVEAFLSRPVHDIREDAFVYKALGRMMARRVRHLVTVEPATRRATGMITGRALLKLRVDDTLQLGDRLDVARNAADMAAVRAELPGLVRRMLAEGVGVMNASAVISQVYCDMTRRATELAVAAMAETGKGDAPAPWAMLVLGSGGRGESLLAPDQDNAIVHEGSAKDDPWFEEVGVRTSDLLDAAGIPYCKGKVMASNKSWRRSREEWQEEILRWLRTPQSEALLLIGIFFDFVPVYGDFELAGRLREFAGANVANAQLFLNFMAAQIEHHHAPLGIFGGFSLTGGRFDLKLGGLFPVTCGARTMALKLGSPVNSTAERLAAAMELGALKQDDMEKLQEAHRLLMRVILDQQIDDIEAGLEPGPLVDPRSLPRGTQARLKQALKSMETVSGLTRDVVGIAGRD